jgi:hypothetical protein
MTDAGIGRVLVASLHQGIADILPSRLEFYENWLNTAGLRDGTIGLAPLNAVLSFLRREGEAYALITTRAGEYAADWTVEGMSGAVRSAIRAMPLWLRTRAVLEVGRRLICRTYRSSRAIVRLRRGSGTIDLRGSIFCSVREPLDYPLCVFYSAAISRLFMLFGLHGDVQVTQCRAAGGRACTISIAIRDERTVSETAVAA